MLAIGTILLRYTGWVIQRYTFNACSCSPTRSVLIQFSPHHGGMCYVRAQISYDSDPRHISTDLLKTASREPRSRNQIMSSSTPSSVPVEHSTPTICDGAASFAAGVSALSSSPTIFLDCEGVKLGRIGGQLCLITIRAPPLGAQASHQTYIFDITSLSRLRLSLQPQFAIITSPEILKVVWDGRMDNSALHHNHGVDLHNVLDLQLVDIHSRRLRGENKLDQAKRLIGCVSLSLLQDMNHAQHRYSRIHRLQCLGQALVEHQPDARQRLSKSPGADPTLLVYYNFHCDISSDLSATNIPREYFS